MVGDARGETNEENVMEVHNLARALRASKGNITKAAETLGMKRPRLSQIIHATPKLGVVKREASDS